MAATAIRSKSAAWSFSGFGGLADLSFLHKASQNAPKRPFLGVVFFLSDLINSEYFKVPKAASLGPVHKVAPRAPRERFHACFGATGRQPCALGKEIRGGAAGPEGF